MTRGAGAWTLGFLAAVGLWSFGGTLYGQGDKAIRIRDGSVEAELINSALGAKQNDSHKWNQKADTVTVSRGPSPDQACSGTPRIEAARFESVSFTVVNENDGELYHFTATNRGFIWKKLTLTLDEAIVFTKEPDGQASAAQQKAGQIRERWDLELADGARHLKLTQIAVTTRPAHKSGVVPAADGHYLCAEFRRH